MSRHQVFPTAVLCGALIAAFGSGACGRNEQATSVPEVQSQATHPANTPISVAGCLKAGEASDTYVLTSARAEGRAESATYQLVGGPDTNLRERIGERVQVSGTLEARQTSASQTVATPAEGDRSTGTSGTAGTPTVQTRTNVEINRLSVDSVTPLGEKCD